MINELTHKNYLIINIEIIRDEFYFFIIPLDLNIKVIINTPTAKSTIVADGATSK